MQISYYGLTCFKIQARPGGRSTDEMTFYFDPLDGEEGLRNVYGNAEVIFLTSQKNKPSLKGIKGDPEIFTLPGEYSYRDMKVIGFEGGSLDEKFIGDRTVYLIEMEDVSIAHLGKAGSLTKEAIAEMSGCDIVMIPIGGGEAFDAKQAASVLRLINPKVIIPMYYALPNVKDSLQEKEVFYKEMGVKDKEIATKLTVKAKDLSNRNMDIIELEPNR